MESRGTDCGEKRAWLGIVAFAVVTTASLKSEPPAYLPLRYDEDFSSLRNPSRQNDPLDAVKFIPLGSEPGEWLTIGGESRTRYEYFDHTLWGQGPQDDNGFWLQRTMLHADLHLSETLRIFAQLKSGLEGGREGGPRPPDEDRLDLNQAFVDVKTEPSAPVALTLRAGRQELGFGSSRVVSYREGPNVRQSFDGARAMLKSTDWQADAFWVSPVTTKIGTFDDHTDSAQSLWGGYLVGLMPAVPGVHLDFYYLGYTNEHARFDQGTGREERHSFGTRVWGRTGPWDFNFEGLCQFGTFGRGSINAWTFASDTGFTFTDVAGKPRVGLKADIASGDRDPRNAGLQTFNALFPRGGYFNDSAIIGPANFVDLHPAVEIHPTGTLTLSFDSDFYWRQSRQDGIYGPALNLIRSGNGTEAMAIGIQPSMRGEWKAGRHWTFVTTVAYFVAGEFLKQSGPGKNSTYFTSWATYLF
jgi:hypothetical protein